MTLLGGENKKHMKLVSTYKNMSSVILRKRVKKFNP